MLEARAEARAECLHSFWPQYDIAPKALFLDELAYLAGSDCAEGTAAEVSKKCAPMKYLVNNESFLMRRKAVGEDDAESEDEEGDGGARMKGLRTKQPLVQVEPVPADEAMKTLQPPEIRKVFGSLVVRRNGGFGPPERVQPKDLLLWCSSDPDAKQIRQAAKKRLERSSSSSSQHAHRSSSEEHDEDDAPRAAKAARQSPEDTARRKTSLLRGGRKTHHSSDRNDSSGQ